jgi:poly(A) polymerase
VDVPVQTHGIDPNLVDERALNVVRTLHDSGFEAYVVGGAVRDLLVGLRPKDFDVATNATPEQVKGLFRRAFIIGRRFRIVHVVFGRGREHEVIEVSTFRAYLDNAAAEQVAGNEKTSKSELAGMKHAVDSTGVCCATTSGARRKKTPCAAISPSMPCTTTRKRRSWWTTTMVSRT